MTHATTETRPSPVLTARSCLLWVTTALLITACSSSEGIAERNGSTTSASKDPKLEEEAQRRAMERDADISRNADFSRALVQLDKALDEYTTNVAKSEHITAQRRAESLKQYLETQARRFFKPLVGIVGSEDARHRGIASAALGFSGDEAVIEPLENALDDSEDFVRINAALGLGQLASPKTPLDRLIARTLDTSASIEARRAAAWALFRIQSAVRPKGDLPFRDGKLSMVWPKLLEGETLDKDGILAVHALRGLGLLRDPATVDSATRYLSHPQALIRQAALVAVARTHNRKAAPLVFPLLSPTEQNPNVRLTARKALKALTGDRVDHEYDLKAWRGEFRDVIEAQEAASTSETSSADPDGTTEKK